MFSKPYLQAAYSVCQQLCSALQGNKVSPTREPEKISIRTKGPASPQPPLPPVLQAQPARLRGAEAQAASAVFTVYQRLRVGLTEVTVTMDSVWDNSILGLEQGFSS